VKSELLNPENLKAAIIYGAILLTLAFLITRGIHAFFQEVAHYVTDRTPIKFLSQVLQMGVYAIGLIIYAQIIPALHSLGTALLAGVSIVSIVVGLAAQNTLGNLIAGFSVLLYHPFRVGDRVQIATPRGIMTGTIDSLTLGYTFLHTEEKEEIIVPNSAIANSVIVRLPPRTSCPGGEARTHR
jgi:small-conductance mechanosensitive channel